MQQDLVRQAQAGDHDAFAALLRDTVADLYGTARLILRDHDRAQDAVQDALVIAWRDIRGLRGADRLEVWLDRILVRSCSTIARRKRRRNVTEIAVRPPPDTGRSGAIGALTDRDRIERAFGRLSQDQRTVLALVCFAGLTLPDASIAMGVSSGKATSRFRQALEALDTAMAAADELTQVWDGQIA